MPSRDLNDLHPHVQQLAEAHVELCKQAGIDLLIYCTLRTFEEQALAYAQGRTTPGKIITMAQPGRSAHQPLINGKALAYDCVPMVQGKAMWNDYDMYMRVGELGERVGLEWAGRWHSFKETAHFQCLGDLSIADILAGKRPAWA